MTVTATDAQTGIVTTTNYRTDIPYDGLISSQTVKSGTTTLRSVANTYAATSLTGGAYAITLTQSVLTQNDLDGSAFPTVTTAYTYDAYNNPLTVTATVSDGSSRTATNTYTNDTTNWILGQLTSTNVQSIVGSSNLTRHFTFVNDPTSGLITQANIEPGTPSLALATDIGYDAYGNTNSVSQSGSGITTRGTTAIYGTNGTFPRRLPMRCRKA